MIFLFLKHKNKSLKKNKIRIYLLALKELSVISPCFSFTLILGYMMIKEFRQQPGDFFLGFAIGEIGLAITSLVESIYDSNHNDGLDASEDFCFWIAIFRVLFRRTIRIYHACYIIYYIVSLQSSLKSSSIPRAAYHVIPWLVGFILLVVQINSNSLGKTLQGTCDVMSSPQNDRFNPLDAKKNFLRSGIKI